MKQAQLRVVSDLLLAAIAGGVGGGRAAPAETQHGLRGDHLQWLAGWSLEWGIKCPPQSYPPGTRPLCVLEEKMKRVKNIQGPVRAKGTR